MLLYGGTSGLCFEFLEKVIEFEAVMVLVNEYIGEFYKLSIRYGKNEESLEYISIYVNGLNYAIRDEFNVLNFHYVMKA